MPLEDGLREMGLFWLVSAAEFLRNRLWIISGDPLVRSEEGWIRQKELVPKLWTLRPEPFYRAFWS